MPICGFFDFILKRLEVFKHFTLLPHGIDQGVSRKVIDECDIISASAEWLSKSIPICRSGLLPRLLYSHLFQEWMLVLFAKLACLANTNALLFCKIWEPDDDSFGLHVLKLLEIDVVDSLVPQFQVGFNFLAFSIHGRLYLA